MLLRRTGPGFMGAALLSFMYTVRFGFSRTVVAVSAALLYGATRRYLMGGSTTGNASGMVGDG